MLERDSLTTEIAPKAYDDVKKFLDKTGFSASAVLVQREGVRGLRALMFAEEKEVPVVKLSKFPKSGYASWLFGPTPQIAVDMEQIKQWKPNAVSKSGEIENCNSDIQLARVILHEIGHCRIHGEHLLSPDRIDPNGWAEPAKADEEEEAWVYSGLVLALFLGKYALEICPNGYDNTSKIPI